MVWTPPHVDPANAGIHSDAANHDPARGDLVDRRIKCADDVGGGLGRSRNGGGAETGNVDYAMTGNRALAKMPWRIDPASTGQARRIEVVRSGRPSVSRAPDQARRRTWESDDVK